MPSWTSLLELRFNKWIILAITSLNIFYPSVYLSLIHVRQLILSHWLSRLCSFFVIFFLHSLDWQIFIDLSQVQLWLNFYLKKNFFFCHLQSAVKSVKFSFQILYISVLECLIILFYSFYFSTEIIHLFSRYDHASPFKSLKILVALKSANFRVCHHLGEHDIKSHFPDFSHV